MHFLEVFKQIILPEMPLSANLCTTLHRARKRRVIVDATNVASILTLDPKKKDIVGLIAQDLLSNIIFVFQVIDTMVGSKMLDEMIFSAKCIGACVLNAVRIWKLGGFISILHKIVGAGI